MIAVSISLLAAVAAAQEAGPRGSESEANELLTGLQDNSFLLEEGYNQDPGMVQHINVFLYDREEESWEYAFTQEWPLFSMKHQLSYTVPLTYERESEESLQLGNIALNYRYQLVGNGESRVAVAPRLSVFLPTGDDDETTAEDEAATAAEIGIPISTILGSRLIGHTNFAARWFEDDRDMEYLAAQSLIVPITPRFNVLVEGVWTGNNDEHDLVISPGIRWAYNLASGAQIVPGFAYVMDADDDDDNDDAFLFYFSYENPFGRRK